MQHPYADLPTIPEYLPQHRSTFGADPVVPPESGMQLSGMWMTVQLMTPQWLKETVTISLGVFGGMALFRVFSRRLPKPQ